MKVLTIAVALFLVMGYASANGELWNVGDTYQLNNNDYIVLDGEDYAECPAPYYEIGPEECETLHTTIRTTNYGGNYVFNGFRPNGCIMNNARNMMHFDYANPSTDYRYLLICRTNVPGPQYQLSNKHTGVVCTPAADVDLAAYMSDKPVPYLAGDCLIEQV